MHIELLDPRWKSQRDILEARKAQSSELQRGANVVSSLKNLARSRVDIFGGKVDEEWWKRQEEEEREKRKEREKVVWDGHTASKKNALNKFQTNVDFDKQIAAISGFRAVCLTIHFFSYSSFIDLSFVAKRLVLLGPALDQLLLLLLCRAYRHRQHHSLHHLQHQALAPIPPRQSRQAHNPRQCTQGSLHPSCFHPCTIKVWMQPNHLDTSLPHQAAPRRLVCILPE